MKIRTGVAAAAIGAMSLVTAVPAHAAAADEGPCRIMGPYYVEGAVSCACIVAATIGQTVLPDSQWMCPSP